MTLQKWREADTSRETGESCGTVWLVGAGPGDPDLISLRGLKLLQQADVVVYDRLVAPELLEHTRDDAICVYVGKRRSLHSVPQDEINALLLRHAKAGRMVLRLKGGDPFVFGRGGEEMLELRRHGIKVLVVPGITAASGCAAATGIPLTHRELAGGVSLMTAHRCDGAQPHDWAALTADPHRTLVFYMGLSEVQSICEELMLHGMPADTPAALISEGTTVRQRALRCTVATMPARAACAGLASPCLIMIGKVVTLADPSVMEHALPQPFATVSCAA